MKLNKLKFEIALANSGHSATSLAREVGLSQSIVSKTLSGTRNMSPRTVGKVAKGLGVKVEDIIEMEV